MHGVRNGWAEQEEEGEDRHHGQELADTGKMGDGASTDSDSEEVAPNTPYQSAH